MPFTLTVTAAPSRLRNLPVQTDEPLWRRLHRAADRVRPTLHAFWLGVFQDFRRGVKAADLRDTMETPSILEPEQVMRDVWETTVDRPARRLLPVLLAAPMTDAAEASIPEVRDLAEGANVSYREDAPEARQSLERYAGQQAWLLAGTTFLALRHQMRRDVLAGVTPAARVRHIEQVAGLTPRQARALDQYEARLAAAGQTVAQRVGPVQEAAARGLAQRVRAIADTQSMRVVNMASEEVIRQAVQRGIINEQGLKRYWTVTPDERLCSRCLAVAEANRDGVGLFEPFQSADGPLDGPPLHSLCRCVATTGRG